MEIRVAFLGYNRPGYFSSTMASWRTALVGGDRYRPTLYLEPSPAEAEMRRLFRGTGPVRVNPRRLGIETNYFATMGRIFGEDPTVEAVVMAEDDVLVSSDVMDYFEWAFAEHAKDDSILAVCAFSNLTVPDGFGPEHGIRYPYFFPWVWGTWRNRWEELLEPQWEFRHIPGWDVGLGVVMNACGLRCAMPAHTRADHIGAVGIHMRPEGLAGTRHASFLLDRPRGTQFSELPYFGPYDV